MDDQLQTEVTDPRGAPAAHASLRHARTLLLRFILFNAIAAALALAALAQGWLAGLFKPATWPGTAIIGAVFIYGLAVSALKTWQTSRALDEVRSGRFGPDARVVRYLETADFGSEDNRLVQINLLRMRLSHKIGIVRLIANMLVFLGLIGTVVGFIIALSGVDPKTAGDASNIANMVATLIAGMSVALYTTLLGAVLNLWLTVNYRLLSTGTMNLLGAIVEAGELQSHARRP